MEVTLTEEAGATAVYARLTNDKPLMDLLTPQISVNATYFEGNSTYLDSSIYEYKSPVATDTEKDAITVKVSGQEGKQFLKITYDKKEPFFIA